MCSVVTRALLSLRPPLTERTTNSDRYTAKANGSRVSMRASPAPAAPRARRRGGNRMPAAHRVSVCSRVRDTARRRERCWAGHECHCGDKEYGNTPPTRNTTSVFYPNPLPPLLWYYFLLFIRTRVCKFGTSSPLALHAAQSRGGGDRPHPGTAAHGLSCVKERGATTPATLPEPVAARRAGALV